MPSPGHRAAPFGIEICSPTLGSARVGAIRSPLSGASVENAATATGHPTILACDQAHGQARAGLGPATNPSAHPPTSPALAPKQALTSGRGRVPVFATCGRTTRASLNAMVTIGPRGPALALARVCAPGGPGPSGAPLEVARRLLAETLTALLLGKGGHIGAVDATPPGRRPCFPATTGACACSMAASSDGCFSMNAIAPAPAPARAICHASNGLRRGGPDDRYARRAIAGIASRPPLLCLRKE